VLRPYWNHPVVSWPFGLIRPDTPALVEVTTRGRIVVALGGFGLGFGFGFGFGCVRWWRGATGRCRAAADVVAAAADAARTTTARISESARTKGGTG